METLIGVFGLIIGFSGLIFIHELGHFLLAKWNGVRVYVFSLGMGPYLMSFTYKGTIYALSAIPIGGYVKMMGQDDMNPSEDPSKDPTDYRNKRPGQKAAILAAGAVFNIIFTIFAFFVCYAYGMDMKPPRIGFVGQGSPMTLAKEIDSHGVETGEARFIPGDRILEVNGVPVKSTLELMVQVSGIRPGEDINLKIERADPHRSGHIYYALVKTKYDQRLGASAIGYSPYREKVSLPIGFTTVNNVVIRSDPNDPARKGTPEDLSEMPAAKADLKKGDKILQINTKPVTETTQMIDLIQASKGEPVTLLIRRAGEADFTKTFAPAKKTGTAADYWSIGAEIEEVAQVSKVQPGSEVAEAGLKEGNVIRDIRLKEKVWETRTNPVYKTLKLEWKESWESEAYKSALVHVPENAGPDALSFEFRPPAVEFYKREAGDAIRDSWDDTVRFSGSVFSVLRGLLTGIVSPKNLSGAIGIGNAMFNVASDQTFMEWLWLLGFISLNLGVLQLVPIPLLDGWHLLMVLIEKLKGSPVAPKIQEAFQYVGLFLVGGLLLLSTYNDIMRFFTK